jgi:hypothetical protein
MRTYEVILTKSYMVTIDANSEEEAIDLTTFFTGDAQDISNESEQKEFNFKIQKIKCTVNEADFWGKVEN